MRRRALRILVVVAGLCLVAAGAAAGYAFWQARSLVDEFHAGAKRQVVDAARPELDVAPVRPADPAEALPAKAQTILLIGSDHRFGEPERHSDTILLVRLDPDRDRAALLSVPRDLYVDIPRHGHARVNDAYGIGGPALLIRTLREVLGVKINHFFDLNFDGFTRLVDALGGVYLPIDQRYFNRNVGTFESNYSNIDLHPGYQRLTGREALQFVRYRHTDSDRFRASREQLFILATARQVLGTHRYDLPRVRRLLRAFARATTSDVDGLRELWGLVGASRAAVGGHLPRYTIPSRDLQLYGAAYVTSGQRQIRRTVRRWLDVAGRPAAVVRPGRSSSTARAPVRLAWDASSARRLLAATRQWVPCAPHALPPGFYWPSGEPARAYTLRGHPAAAVYATRGSGRSLLWTWTTWQHPPALDSPSRIVRRGGREYEVTLQSGRVRQVAWRVGEWRVWITNTLRDEVSGRTLLKLAETCRSG